MSRRVSVSRQEPSVYDIAVETDTVPELKEWIKSDLIAKSAIMQNKPREHLNYLTDKADAAYDTFARKSNFNQTKSHYKVVLPRDVRESIFHEMSPSTKKSIKKHIKRKKKLTFKKRLGNLRKSLTRRLRRRPRSRVSKRGVGGIHKKRTTHKKRTLKNK